MLSAMSKCHFSFSECGFLYYFTYISPAHFNKELDHRQSCSGSCTNLILEELEVKLATYIMSEPVVGQNMVRFLIFKRFLPKKQKEEKQAETAELVY